MLIKKKYIANKFQSDDFEEHFSKPNKLINSDLDYQQLDFQSRKDQQIPKKNNQVFELSEHDEDLIQEKIKLRELELLEKLELEISQKKQNALDEIQSMIDSASNQAQQVLNSAEQKADELEEELLVQKNNFETEKKIFLQEVKSEKQKAFEQGMAEARVYFDEFTRYLSEFHKMEKTALSEAYPQITSIALDVARQILNYEAQSNPKLLEQQVLRSIEKVITSKGVIQIYLNPAQTSSSTQLEQALLRLLDQNTRVVFLEDPSVDLGSCVINTQGGRLNASFRAQLEVIKSSFEKYLGYLIDDSILDLPEPIEQTEPIQKTKKISRTKKEKSNKKSTSKSKKNKSLDNITEVKEPSDDELDLIDNEELNLDFDNDLASLLDDLMGDIETDLKSDSQDNSKILPKNSKLGFNDSDKDLLMEDQMAKFLDDEFEDNEDLDEEQDDTFEFEEELEEEEEEEEDLEDFEEFGEDDFAEDEEDEDEEDPRYPEY